MRMNLPQQSRPLDLKIICANDYNYYNQGPIKVKIFQEKHIYVYIIYQGDVMFAVVLLDLGEQRPLHVSLIDCQSCRVLYSEDILQPWFVFDGSWW